MDTERDTARRAVDNALRVLTEFASDDAAVARIAGLQIRAGPTEKATVASPPIG